DIFYEIHKNNSDSILMLVGQGPLEDEIKNKVDTLNLTDSVKFLGQRNDAFELYQAFDVFILPSLYEGLPVVGVEAQVAGLLCFLSDEMTKETKVLNTTKFMSLSNLPSEWANEVLHSIKNFKRKDTKDEVSKYGFNIEIEAKKLEKYYVSLASKGDL
ncbi:MAG: glycosyltransferase, partial [Bacilli bacterium]|nr:glycosyltransferase [Bacilli bacterium]